MASEPCQEMKGKPGPFPVNGQGTFIYTTKNNLSFSIYVTPQKSKGDSPPSQYIALRVDEESARFVLKRSKCDEEEILEHIKNDPKKHINVGTQPNVTCSYWYSYDRDGLILKYGKGYAMEETTLLSHDFLADAKTEKEKKKIREEHIMHLFFNADQRKFVMVFAECLPGEKPLIEIEPTFQFSPNPFVSNFSALVLDSTKVTLFDLDRGQYTLSSSLPTACQELYNNIKGLDLEYPDNPIMKLSDALRYSILTPGCTLYKKLKDKEGEFGPHNPKMAYLRVTLGPNQRTAPGIPYVLELWPSGHTSPIHNHGASCAVIKVLFGRITVKIFNKQTNPPNNTEPVKKFDIKKDDITWISPDWFQTHQLVNNTNDFCATIQCYRYEADDKIHWPGFDFVSNTPLSDTYQLDVFFPNTDFTFMNMRSIVLKEYKQFLEGPKQDEM